MRWVLYLLKFYEDTKNEGRWVKEQILNLSKIKREHCLSHWQNYQQRTELIDTIVWMVYSKELNIIINNINGFVNFHGLEQATSSYRKRFINDSQHLWARWAMICAAGTGRLPAFYGRTAILPDSLIFISVCCNRLLIRTWLVASHYIAPTSTQWKKVGFLLM